MNVALRNQSWPRLPLIALLDRLYQTIQSALLAPVEALSPTVGATLRATSLKHSYASVVGMTTTNKKGGKSVETRYI